MVGSNSATSGSRIACIRTYWLQCPLPEAVTIAHTRMDRRDVAIVQVIATNGAEGWGECCGPPSLILPAIQSFYAPLLIGKEAPAYAAHWEQLWNASYNWARRGILLGALSGLDIALWDLTGHLLGRSVSDIIGGRIRDRIPCYATGLYFRDRPEAELIPSLVAEAVHQVEFGFRGVKAQIGRNPAFDAALVRALRTALPNTPLMADACSAYSLPEAMAIGKILEEANFTFMEDPLSPEHADQYQTLAQHARVPLAAGEWEQTRWGFQSLLTAGGIVYPQVLLAYCGGLTEGLRIRSIVNSHGLNITPIALGTPLHMAAAVHYIATDIRRPGRGEISPGLLGVVVEPDPIRENLCPNGLNLEGGLIDVPKEPGLGVKVSPEALRFFTVKQEECRG